MKLIYFSLSAPPLSLPPRWVCVYDTPDDGRNLKKVLKTTNMGSYFDDGHLILKVNYGIKLQFDYIKCSLCITIPYINLSFYFTSEYRSSFLEVFGIMI